MYRAKDPPDDLYARTPSIIPRVYATSSIPFFYPLNSSSPLLLLLLLLFLLTLFPFLPLFLSTAFLYYPPLCYCCFPDSFPDSFSFLTPSPDSSSPSPLQLLLLIPF